MAKTPKLKWKMEFRISHIDGKALTKRDHELIDRITVELKALEGAEVTVDAR